MPDDPYSLADLARLADVTPRTVRYYIVQGLLHSPEAAGPATRYGDGHLARLRLIRRFQRDHLPLAEIRARLLAMTDDQILSATAAPQPEPAGPSEALDYVHELMAQSGVAPSLRPHASAEAPVSYRPSLLKRIEVAPPAAPGALTDASVPPPASDAIALDAFAAPAPAASAPVTPEPATPAHSTQPDRSTWERLVITPDVELHVRRPLDRRTNQRVDKLERIARELLRDDD